MSLTKLLKAPSKLFLKNVISFLIIRRYDLGLKHEMLRYITVKPNASISVLRYKIWHLLDLPDYCDEVIILKTKEGIEIPLTDLKKGNSPECPFILEVWLNNREGYLATIPKNMIMMGNNEQSCELSAVAVPMEKQDNRANDNEGKTIPLKPTIANDRIELNKQMYTNTKPNNLLYKQSEISCRFSNTSIFKLNKKKSKDNFTNLLLKIQSDLSCLSNKLTVLENKIPTC